MSLARRTRRRLKPEYLPPKAQSWKKAISLALGVIILLSSYLFVYHSHYYDSYIRSLASFGFMAGLLALHFIWIDPLARPKFYKYLLALASLAGCFGGFIQLQAVKDDILARHRARDGVVGQARIIDYEVETRKGQTTQYIIFQYNYRGTAYKQRVVNSQSLHFGDSLDLYYSASDPENVLITGIRRLDNY